MPTGLKTNVKYFRLLVKWSEKLVKWQKQIEAGPSHYGPIPDGANAATRVDNVVHVVQFSPKQVLAEGALSQVELNSGMARERYRWQTNLHGVEFILFVWKKEEDPAQFNQVSQFETRFKKKHFLTKDITHLNQPFSLYLV